MGHATLQAGAYQSYYHFAKFTGHKLFSSRDIIILICHVILQDLVIKGLCDFMGRSTSR